MVFYGEDYGRYVLFKVLVWYVLYGLYLYVLLIIADLTRSHGNALVLASPYSPVL